MNRVCTIQYTFVNMIVFVFSSFFYIDDKDISYCNNKCKDDNNNNDYSSGDYDYNYYNGDDNMRCNCCHTTIVLFLLSLQL